MVYREKKSTVGALCDIQIGYTARARLEKAAGGGVPAIQLRDLRGEEEFDPAGLPNYTLGASFERYWAGAGDVLFRSRGERNTAVLVSPNTDSAAIAVMPLVILRPKREFLDPAYLVWVINQPSSQVHFDRHARGQGMRMIPMPALESLEVPLPPLSDQHLIGQIDTLAKRERMLTHALADKKFELREFALLQQAKNAQPHGNGTGRIGRPPRGGQT